MRKMSHYLIPLLLLMPSFAAAQGLQCLGRATVVETGVTPNIVTTIQGAMNVRWNGITQTNFGEFIRVNGSATTGSPVVIFARTGDGTTSFCVVGPGSTFYAVARNLLVGGGSGTLITARKVEGSNVCTLLNLQKHSCRQD